MNATPESRPLDKAGARVEAQRERILVAAQKCFVERGFHAASMANIAETAGMSAGLIYRYFAGKSEIILAIVELQLDMLLNEIKLKRKVDMTSELIASFTRCSDDQTRGMNPALLLEMSAEATRDPRIAAAVNDFDLALRNALTRWLAEDQEQGGRGLSEPLARQRALLVQLLFDGLKVRQTREPDLDRKLLEAALREFVPQLLTT